ncbi:MAG: hypothetical protein QME90_12945, partial [Thermodesulfobacteriota bacterium]|nr:hypothetical protein [Thermodesulfobacteriota bacterium]
SKNHHAKGRTADWHDLYESFTPLERQRSSSGVYKVLEGEPSYPFGSSNPHNRGVTSKEID